MGTSSSAGIASRCPFRAGSDFQYQLAVEVAVVRALHIGDLRNDAFGLIDLGIPESQSVLADGQLVALLVLQQRIGVVVRRAVDPVVDGFRDIHREDIKQRLETVDDSGYGP